MVALFRAALLIEKDVPDLEYAHEAFGDYFEEGEDQQMDPPDTSETRYDTDGEYEGTLDTLSTMFSNLPEGWQNRWRHSIQTGYFPWCGWTDIIEDITKVLNISAPDVLAEHEQDEDEEDDCPDFYTSEDDSDSRISDT